MNEPTDPVVRALLWVGTFILIVVLGINVWVLASGRITSARAIDRRIANLTTQVEYLTCLNRFPVDQRDTVIVGACDTDS